MRQINCEYGIGLRSALLQGGSTWRLQGLIQLAEKTIEQWTLALQTIELRDTQIQ